MSRGLLQRPVTSPLAMDDAITIAYLPSNAHARNRLRGLDVGYDVAVAAPRNITIKTGPVTANGLLNSAGLVIGGTDTSVKSLAFQYVVDRIAYGKAIVTAGTALAAGTIPEDAWGIYLFSILDGTITCTPGAANFTTGYVDEPAAIAALPATPSGASMGHITVLTHADNDFIGNTDALQGGSTGNVSADTNYYQTTPIVLTTVVIIPWDFNAGAYARIFPVAFHTELNQALAVELAASGTGSTDGYVTMWVEAP